MVDKCFFLLFRMWRVRENVVFFFLVFYEFDNSYWFREFVEEYFYLVIVFCLGKLDLVVNVD